MLRWIEWTIRLLQLWQLSLQLVLDTVPWMPPLVVLYTPYHVLCGIPLFTWQLPQASCCVVLHLLLLRISLMCRDTYDSIWKPLVSLQQYKEVERLNNLLHPPCESAEMHGEFAAARCCLRNLYYNNKYTIIGLNLKHTVCCFPLCYVDPSSRVSQHPDCHIKRLACCI